MKFTRSIIALLALLMALCLTFTGCDLGDLGLGGEPDETFEKVEQTNKPTDKDDPADKPTEKPTDAPENNEGEGNDTARDPICDLLGIPYFSGDPWTPINDNKPTFTEEEITTEGYEFYSELDNLGRCGYVMACVGTEMMPTEDRGDIGSIKPTGWVQKQYDGNLVSGGNLYNRCHLIGFQLTGENANKKNLITGTRYMNIEGMLPFENMIADYVKETGNHVIYRVTPIFSGNNLVCDGVQMEAVSVEDKGDGICFNVFAYNVQPGIMIDYATGKSWLDNGNSTSSNGDENEAEYVLNTNSKKIHRPTCSSVKDMNPDNKKVSNESKETLINKGYSSCKLCNP